MCAGEHQVNEYKCGVIRCNKGKRKLCIYIMVRYANCNRNHQANSAQFPSKQKAEVQARKKKPAKEITPKASPKLEASPEYKASPSLNEASPSPDNITPDSGMGMDLESESWAENKENYNSNQDEIPEGINHSEKFEC